MLDKLTPSLIKEMFRSAVHQLEKFREVLNKLNVYPVPDGDTGNNMLLTLKEPVEKALHLTKIKEILKGIAKEALFCARGNSGIILSQFLWGFAEACTSDEYIDASTLEKMFNEGTKAAYTAMSSPEEGTILTVIREVTERLSRIYKREKNMLKIFKNLYNQSKKTIKKTPDMLRVLKEAGVVDAGGQGFVYFLRGFYISLRKRFGIRFYPSLTEGLLQFIKTTVLIADKGQKLVFSSGKALISKISKFLKKEIKLKKKEVWEKLPEYRFCVEMVIVSDVTPEKVKNELKELGNSLLAVKRENILHLHIHTNEPFKVEEIGRSYGEILKTKIDDIYKQHEELIGSFEDREERIGIIAVANGEGFEEIFLSMGADEVVRGKETQNPSVEEILFHLMKIKTKKVIILPNDPNVILAAKNAAKFSPAETIVIPTKTMPEGISALLSFDPNLSLEENKKKMEWAMSCVKTGSVTVSTRDKKGKIDIKKGDIIGIGKEEIEVKGENPEKVLQDLIQKMLKEEDRLISIFYGKEVNEERVKNIRDIIKKKYPGCDVEVYYGGQPNYFYIVSLE